MHSTTVVLLRRQEQLVGDLRVLGFPLFGFDNADPGWRSHEVGAGGTPDVDDVPILSAPPSYTAPERDEPFGRSATRSASHAQSAQAAHRCAIALLNTPARRLTWRSIRRKASLRGGHIPGAKNVPWARAANPDGTFKTAERAARDLRERA